MFHANVRNVTIADGVGFVGGHADDHFLYIVRVERTLLKKIYHGIKRRLNGGAHRPLLDIGAGDFVALAEFVDEDRWIGFDGAVFARSECFVKIVGAGKNVVDAAPAGTYETRGEDGDTRGFASE